MFFMPVYSNPKTSMDALALQRRRLDRPAMPAARISHVPTRRQVRASAGQHPAVSFARSFAARGGTKAGSLP